MTLKPLQSSEMWRGSTTAVISGINLYQPLVLALLPLAHRRTESTPQKLGWAWLFSQEFVGWVKSGRGVYRGCAAGPGRTGSFLCGSSTFLTYRALLPTFPQPRGPLVRASQIPDTTILEHSWLLLRKTLRKHTKNVPMIRLNLHNPESRFWSLSFHNSSERRRSKRRISLPLSITLFQPFRKWIVILTRWGFITVIFNTRIRKTQYNCRDFFFYYHLLILALGTVLW